MVPLPRTGAVHEVSAGVVAMGTPTRPSALPIGRELVDFIQKAGTDSDGIIVNAGGYSHTSVVIADAIKTTKVPVDIHFSSSG